MFHHLYLIGNGFDISHGLNTAYDDFGRWLVSRHSADAFLLREFLPTNKKDMLWSSFEEALGKFELDKVKDNDLQNLFVITYIDDNREQVAAQDIADPNIFERLGKHFSDWARDINTGLNKICPKCEFPDGSLFLTFNYTDTLEFVYNVNEDCVKHLNGRAATDKSVVIGHNRKVNPFEAYTGNAGNIRKENNGFLQLSEYADLRKDGHKQVEKAFVNFPKDELRTIKDVIVLGHSYGRVDDSYFQSVISYLPDNITWHLGYHTANDEKHLNAFVGKFKITNFKAFIF